jgi:hypothetical protein
VVVTSKRRLALLQRPDGVLVRVDDGQEIDGWTVDAITRAGVILRRGSIRQELTLTDTGSGPGTGASNPPRARQRS